ncbi:MAG TPA: hypothetical protein VJJ21_04405 [Candidatus Nanoarchaeia archaeon]|nr:hypothetical protein [Candidatus Nanoarchaeia archaeon]
MVKSESPLDLKDDVSHVRYDVEETAYRVSTVQLHDGKFESAYSRFGVGDMVELLRKQPSNISLWLMVRQTSLWEVLEATQRVSTNPPLRVIRQYQDENSAQQGHQEIIQLLQNGQEKEVLRL